MANQAVTIVLDALPLKTGGGVQVALDLLEQIAACPTGDRWILVARENTPFQDPRYLVGIDKAVFVPDNVFRRAMFAMCGGAALVREVRADIVYTIFGPQWYNLSVPQIVGCAYSNLFYPEIQFWRRLGPASRAFKKLIDLYRLKRAHRADLVLFETEDLARRAIALREFRSDQVRYLPPAVSSLVTPERHHPELAGRLRRLGSGFYVLALCGYHPNKNLEIIPDVLRLLRQEHAQSDVRFLLTMQDCPGARSIMERANQLGVGDGIINLGRVAQEACVELYRACDAVLVASYLESFTNNVPEAWAMGRVLLMPDLAWARGICRDGALYSEYDNPAALAALIAQVRSEPRVAKDAIARGAQRLASYPQSRQRFLSIVELLRERIRT